MLTSDSPDSRRIDYDIVVIGAGFAGMYAITKLREAGFSVHAFEAASGVGGTWYWNRYPGARCDVESLSYQYTFDRDLIEHWTWSERFATQPEILEYAEWVADRFDLRAHITFDTRVDSVVFDEHTATWEIGTADGGRTRARYCLAAVGSLSAVSTPKFPGLDAFAGTIHHTGAWPHEGVDLSGKRVAVIGTGSSGIQVIPEIAKQAARLTVFQRTPNYTLPARNRRLFADEHILLRNNYQQYRERARQCPAGMGIAWGVNAVSEVSDQDRADTLDRYWHHGGNIFLAAFNDIFRDVDANARVAEYVRDRIATIVRDPETARRLTPTDYPIGAKRICVDTDYYATFNLPSVNLVDTREDPITAFTERGIATALTSFEFDVIVMATGYDGMTGPLTRMDIRGRHGLSLKDHWAGGPNNYLGLGVHGFPNLFTVTGPGSPSVLANVIAGIQQHVEWIADCLIYMRDHGFIQIEAESEAEAQWVQHVNDIAKQTLYVHAKSWYLGDNIEGKPRVFMPYAAGYNVYHDVCDEVASAGYRGFVMSSGCAAASAATPSESATP